MKRSWLETIGSFVLAASIFGPAWGSIPPQPGTINYVEGRAAIDGQAVDTRGVKPASLAAGQSLSTEDGRAEILLSAGALVRVDRHSSIELVSPDVAHTVVALQRGRALLEVAEARPEDAVRITEDGASTQLLQPSLYEFDADRSQVRIFDGQAAVQTGIRVIHVKRGHQLTMNSSGQLKTSKFDKNQYIDDFYRWASLRSSYLAEANVDAARTYAGGAGGSPALWNGDGWYWNAGYDTYTFIPDDGIFFDPFGWGFYSPWCAFGAPYWGLGYGYGYGGYGGRYPRRFGPGYHPNYGANSRNFGSAGHAFHVGGSAAGGFNRSASLGGFHGGGFRGGGGGFHGGGGGFHGGGGGGRR
jgi:hypothetical protein